MRKSLYSSFTCLVVCFPLIALAQPKMCRDIFAKTADQITESRASQKSLTPARATTETNIVHGTRPLTGLVYGPQKFFEGVVLPILDQHIYRESDPRTFPLQTELSKLLPTEPRSEFGLEPVQIKTSRIKSQTQGLLDHLYESFAQQGPERQILVDVAKAQDLSESARTVHFLVGQPHASIGHGQILVSRSANEPLHIDTQWPDVKIPGQLRGEVGRLSFFTESEAQLHSEETGIDDHQKMYHRYAELSLISSLFTWANQNAKLDTLSFQINAGVRALLERQLKIPLSLAQRTEVSQIFEGKKITEYLFVFDRAGMQAVQDSIFKQIYSMQVSRLSDFQPKFSEKLVLRYRRDQFRTLFRSGVFGSKSAALLKALDDSERLGETPSSPSPLLFASADFQDDSSDTSPHSSRRRMAKAAHTGAHIGQYVLKYRGTNDPYFNAHPIEDYNFDASQILVVPPGSRLDGIETIEIHLSRGAALQIESTLSTQNRAPTAVPK